MKNSKILPIEEQISQSSNDNLSLSSGLVDVTSKEDSSYDSYDTFSPNTRSSFSDREELIPLMHRKSNRISLSDLDSSIEI